MALADLDGDRLRDVADTITAAGGKAQAFPCDISGLEACNGLVADVVTAFGKLDILVNNAGISRRRGPWRRKMSLNWSGKGRSM